MLIEIWEEINDIVVYIIYVVFSQQMSHENNEAISLLITLQTLRMLLLMFKERRKILHRINHPLDWLRMGLRRYKVILLVMESIGNGHNGRGLSWRQGTRFHHFRENVMYVAEMYEKFQERKVIILNHLQWTEGALEA